MTASAKTFNSPLWSYDPSAALLVRHLGWRLPETLATNYANMVSLPPAPHIAAWLLKHIILPFPTAGSGGGHAWRQPRRPAPAAAAPPRDMEGERAPLRMGA